MPAISSTGAEDGFEGWGSAVHSRHEHKVISRPLAFVAGVAVAGAAVGAPLGVAYWNHGNQINNLKHERDYDVSLLKNQQKINHVQAVLGASGVRFSNVELKGNEELVSVPGTGAACETVTFRFNEEKNGWNLSFQQKDAAGHVFDTPHASSAAGVENLVQDLCSND